jgi:cytochrome P450
VDEFHDYFAEVVERRRLEPGGDLISVLVTAETEEGCLSDEEVRAFCLILLVAGNETTTNLIGNAVLTLLEHPDELSKLRCDRSRVPDALEETLRFESPIQWLPRLATCDTRIAGTELPKGALVLPMYGSANRDKARFPHADRFDVDRDMRGHLGFGFGTHFCLGAGLARLEGRVALEEILERLPGLERTGAPLERAASVFIRGLEKLPLRFDG